MTEYDCEGCGVHVYAFGITRVPRHGFCCTCAWLNEQVVDPELMIGVYRRINDLQHNQDELHRRGLFRHHGKVVEARP